MFYERELSNATVAMTSFIEINILKLREVKVFKGPVTNVGQKQDWNSIVLFENTPCCIWKHLCPKQKPQTAELIFEEY